MEDRTVDLVAKYDNAVCFGDLDDLLQGAFSQDGSGRVLRITGRSCVRSLFLWGSGERLTLTRSSWCLVGSDLSDLLGLTPIHLLGWLATNRRRLLRRRGPSRAAGRWDTGR